MKKIDHIYFSLFVLILGWQQFGLAQASQISPTNGCINCSTTIDILALEPVNYNINTQKQFEESAQHLQEVFNNKQRVTTSLSRNLKHLPADNSRQEARALSTNLAQMKVAAENKGKIEYTGFLAQEVEKAIDKTGYSFSGLVKPTNDKEKYALRYAEFVVPLVGAVQELKVEKDGEIEDLKATVEEQQEAIEQLKALVNTLVEQNAATKKVTIHELILG